MRGNEGFVEFHLAGCVFAVADQDDGFPSGFMRELFFAGQIDGVVQRRSAADLQVIDRRALAIAGYR